MEGILVYIRRTCPDCHGSGTAKDWVRGATHGSGGWRLCCTICFGAGHIEQWLPLAQLLDLKLKIEIGSSQQPAA